MRYSGIDRGSSTSAHSNAHASHSAGGSSSWFDDDEQVTAQYRIMASTGTSGAGGNKLVAGGSAGDVGAASGDSSATAGTEAVPGESTSLLQQSPAFDGAAGAARPAMLSGIVTHGRTSSMVSDGSDPSTPAIAVPVVGGRQTQRTAVQSCVQLVRTAALTVFDPRQAASTLGLIVRNPAARVMFGTRAALYILAFSVILGERWAH